MLGACIKQGICISGKEKLGARDAWSCLASSSSSPTPPCVLHVLPSTEGRGEELPMPFSFKQIQLWL